MDRWKSPIDIEFFTQEFATKINDDQTGYVVKACLDMGINIDKGELLKALQYDRHQYEQGYSDGIRARDSEIVRCKDCKFRDDPDNNCVAYNAFWVNNDDDFCSFGERKETEDDSCTKQG